MSTTAPDVAWWALTSEQALAELASDEHGLSSAEADGRLTSTGPNELREEAGPGPALIFLRQFASPLIYILIAAAIVTTVLEEYIDASIIGAVLVFNAVIGFAQEYRAERSMAALRRLAVARARVLRDGREHEIDVRGLVPGDVVLVEAGARATAGCSTPCRWRRTSRWSPASRRPLRRSARRCRPTRSSPTAPACC